MFVPQYLSSFDFVLGPLFSFYHNRSWDFGQWHGFDPLCASVRLSRVDEESGQRNREIAKISQL